MGDLRTLPGVGVFSCILVRMVVSNSEAHNISVERVQTCSPG